MFYGNGGSENRNQRPVWSQVLEVERQCEFVGLFLFFFSLVESFLRSGSLVNVSIEKQSDGKLSGYIRIRSKTQGIALSLGDKITLKQKGAA